MKSDRLIAQTYLRWRNSPPSLGSLLPKFALLWTILSVLAAALVAIAFLLTDVLDLRWVAVFAVGIVVGGIARDLGWARRSISNWPLLSRLLNWEQVERVAAGDTHSENMPQSPAPPAPRYARAVRIGLVCGITLLLVLFSVDYGMLRLNDPRPGNPDNRIILYTTAWCPYCKALRGHLDAAGIPYTNLDIEKSLSASYEYRAIGGRGVPVTVIGQTVIHGYQISKIDAALVDAGYREQPSAGMETQVPGRQ